MSAGGAQVPAPLPQRPQVLAGLSLRWSGAPREGGEVVVLVHGLGSSSTVWGLVAPALGERFATVLVDLPGHGAAPLPAQGDALLAEMRPAALGRRLLRACRLLGAARVHLVGHSLGGWVVLEAAAEDGAEVQLTGRAPVVASVTALAPAGLWATPRRRPPLLPTGQQFARWGRWIPRSVLRRAWARRLVLVATSAAPGTLPAQVALDAVTAVAGAAGYRAADAGLASGRFERAALVRVPCAVAFGARDRVLPRPGAQLREAAPPGSRWVVWPQCGHVPPWDRPGDCVELVTEVVRSAVAT